MQFIKGRKIKCYNKQAENKGFGILNVNVLIFVEINLKISALTFIYYIEFRKYHVLISD